MRTTVLSVLSATLIVAATVTSAASLNVPDEASIAKLEAKVRLPHGARRLIDYDRYYAYEMPDSGRLTIVGEYVAVGQPGRPGRIRRLADRKDMPVVMDGGCAVVGIAWDVKSATFDGVACNGLA